MDASTDASVREPRGSAAERLAVFLRSVLPADPTQLLFLVGTIFLLITPRLSWKIQPLMPASDVKLHQPPYGSYEAYAYVVFGTLMMLAAGIFALYACFWPARHVVRKTIFYVVFPAFLGLSLIVWKFFDVVTGEKSVLETRSTIQRMPLWIGNNLSHFPTGVYFAVFGLVLIAAFCVRIAVGRAELPLALRRKQGSSLDDQGAWSRIRLLIFFWVGLLASLATLPALAWMIAGMYLPHANVFFAAKILDFATELWSAGLSLGITLFILGGPGRSAARRSLRIPSLQAAGIGLVLAVGVYGAIPFAQYLADHIYWAAHNYGKFGPSILSAYFDPRSLTVTWIVILIFAAFLEELVFRGVVLEIFIKRYGLQPGIFLSGLGWAAIHFRSDYYGGKSVLEVTAALALRIFVCVAMNYALAWMFLRSKSIVPSWIAHTCWNGLIFSGAAASSTLINLGRFALWFAVACVLYRFWPIAEVREDAELPATLPEPGDLNAGESTV